MRSWRTSIATWISDDDQKEAEVLQEESRRSGRQSMCDCKPGDIGTFRGIVRSISLEPASGLPTMEAVLYDGTGRVDVVWMGRRRIIGVEPGRKMEVTGRLTTRDGEPVLYNPRYELLPT